MTEQKTIEIPFKSESETNKTYTAYVENIATMQYLGKFVVQSSINIPREEIEECVKRNVEKIMLSNLSLRQILSLDMSLTVAGYILSLFTIAFFTVQGNVYIVIIGLCILIPTIFHTIDGMVRRWKKMNPTQKTN